MREPAPLPLAPALLMLGLLAGLRSGTVNAQTADVAGGAPIQHCVATDGTQIFTDRSCASMNAAPAPADTAPASAASALSNAPPDASSTGAPPITCAGDIDALKQAIDEAFARHDATRLTGLMLWNGYGVGTVVATTRILAPLMHAPLLDVQAVSDDGASASASSGVLPDAGIGNASAGGGATATSNQASPGNDSDATPDAVQVDVDSDGRHPARSLRFGVVRRAGCLWLVPAPAGGT